jgi:hypothetical protein
MEGIYYWPNVSWNKQIGIRRGTISFCKQNGNFKKSQELKSPSEKFKNT